MTDLIKSTVTKLAHNRFRVDGEIAVIGAEIVHEPYKWVFTTKKEATATAERLDRENIEGIAYVTEYRAARLSLVQDYLARRAARPVTQFTFGF